tara:strand:- start:284 stop:625 length:342 start_codon:yes stop_codon:yes gene_type:complete
MNVKLSTIAYARSGDKGAHSNVGLIFLNAELYKWALQNITTDSVKKHFNDVVKGKIERFTLDNLNAINFILYDSLDGGGSESLLNDAQGKTYGQHLLTLQINLPNKYKDFINE